MSVDAAPNYLTLVELAVPFDAEVDRRMNGFYSDIGWYKRDYSHTELFSYFSPLPSGEDAPTLAYVLSQNEAEVDRFIQNADPTPSDYSLGLRLPKLLESARNWLIVPTDEDVQVIFERGGKLLGAHTHTTLEERAGRYEFSFSDPFNHALRVSSGAPWEVKFTQL